MKSLLKTATQKCVVKRALIMAGVVGSILIAINHGSCFMTGQSCGNCMLKSVVTVLVPYCVSTVSSVLAMRDKPTAH